MWARQFAWALALLASVNGCSGRKSGIEFRYAVLDVPASASDLTLTVDGQHRPSPFAIFFPSGLDRWRCRRVSQSRFEGHMGNIRFAVRSASGRDIACTGDMLYDTSSNPILGIQYMAFFLKSDKEYVCNDWQRPTASTLLRSMTEGRMCGIAADFASEDPGTNDPGTTRTEKRFLRQIIKSAEEKAVRQPSLSPSVR